MYIYAYICIYTHMYRWASIREPEWDDKNPYDDDVYSNKLNEGCYEICTPYGPAGMA
jgi:hypothetical protein